MRQTAEKTVFDLESDLQQMAELLYKQIDELQTQNQDLLKQAHVCRYDRPLHYDQVQSISTFSPLLYIGQ